MEQNPYYVPLNVVGDLVAAKDAAFQLSVQNERLQHQLQMKQLKEEAFSDVQTIGGRAYTFTESGRPVEVMDRAAAAAWKVVHRGPEPQPERYCVEFENGTFVWLTREEYLDDKQLLHVLQTSGIRATIRRSLRLTAGLIRQYLSSRMKEMEMRYYAGWHISGEIVTFEAFEPFSAHQRDRPYELPRALGSVSAAETAIAARAFLDAMGAVRESGLRQLLCLWYHLCALHSLLVSWGEAAPFGIALYAQEAGVRRWLQRLFCWYGDKPIDLDTAPFDFARSLWRRKDQPAVILDRGLTANTGKNAAILGEVLATGKIRCREKTGEERLLPLLAPVTIISGTVSAVVCLPDLLVIDFPAEALEQQREDNGMQEAYLRAFLRYTEQHWLMLQQALRRGKRAAEAVQDWEETDTAALGSLLGIAAFLRTFYGEIGVDCPADLWDETELSSLVGRMSTGVLGEDLAGQFCCIARVCLQEQYFHCCEAERGTWDAEKPTVYSVDGSYCFTLRAFRLVCDRMAVSTPVAARALADAGLLEGRRTNATTLQTRIGVYNEHGILRQVGVYRIAQEAIDTAAY